MLSKVTFLFTKFADPQFNLLVESLAVKLLDPDEKVRAAVCKVYSNLDYETALHHVSVNQWHSVCGRGLDKKVSLSIIYQNILKFSLSTLFEWKP